jgi:KaiC/GvpD/RAD55 family RecA-like ATPase
MRHSTGVPGLDPLLGGGLLPGNLAVVVGATGIGKTQLGVQYADAGSRGENARGIIFDMSVRGDGQNHRDYAARLGDWTLQDFPAGLVADVAHVFDMQQDVGDYLHVFDYSGRRVTRGQSEFELWHQWQAELNSKLQTAIAFFYGNFIRGRRRVVVDGLEPVERQLDSVQFELFEYLYHQILRKDPEWVARDLLREAYRRHSQLAAQHAYRTGDVSCLLLCTSAETMLDDLIARPLSDSDVLTNANTVLYLGKIRDGNRLRRGLYIAKHRGSACADEIVQYEIGDRGLVL